MYALKLVDLALMMVNDVPLTFRITREGVLAFCSANILFSKKRTVFTFLRESRYLLEMCLSVCFLACFGSLAVWLLK